MNPPLKAVLFDAVGTLLRPEPAVAAAYAAAGRRHGVALDEAVVLARFRRAFARQEQLDESDHGCRTDEARERTRWQAIVAEVFPEAAAPEALLAELWRHFAEPAHWRMHDDAAPAWLALAARGFVLAVASNFDQRLHRICRGLAPLDRRQHLFVSSAVGWRKPSPRFFRAIEHALSAAPAELLLVGDDPHNDYQAARQAGWRAVLLDRSGGQGGGERIASLAALEDWLAAGA